MPLTRDQVDTICNSLTSRANAAISGLEGKKSILGSVTGNNDTVEQSEGALRNTISQIQPAWHDAGYERADECTAGNENGAEIASWKSAGEAFASSISEIDSYGQDATLQAVVGQTVQATGAQVAAEASAAGKAVGSIIPWYVYAGGIVVALGIGFIALKMYGPRAA